MARPDPDAFAALLSDWCLEAQEGQQVLVRSTTLAAPLLTALQRALLARGAWPLLRPELPGQQEGFFAAARDAHLDGFPEAEHAVAESVDAFVAIQAPFNTRALAGVDPAAQARVINATRPLRDLRLQKRWAISVWPTEAQAQEAGMALDDFAAFVERALFLDRPDPAGAWRELSDFQAGLVDRLKAAEELHIEADGTDLRLNVKGRTWINSDGRRNMPSGEVFTGPVENSANGHIRFTVPSSPGGVDVADVELTFAAASCARPAPSAARPIWTPRWTPTPGPAAWARSASAPTSGSTAPSARSCSMRRSAAPCTSPWAAPTRRAAASTTPRCTGT